MANRPAPYTQADVTRAVKGAIAAGLVVREVFANANGVRVIADNGKDTPSSENSWDEVLEQIRFNVVHSLQP